MRELLITDIRRIIKDKLFLVSCILGVIFAISTPLLYKGLSLLLGMGGMENDLLGTFTNAKSMFFTSFALGSNFGFVLPILLAIVICKDFSYGTIRNKIICGKSRTKIFLSMFLASTIVSCALMLLHALLTLGASLLFFSYQSEPITSDTIGYALLSIVFALLIYVFVSAIVCFLSVSMKNAGVTTIVYIGVNFLFSIVGAVVAVAAAFVDQTDELLVKAFEIVQKANLFTTTHIGTGLTYEFIDVICVLAPVVLGTAGCIFFGITIFNKKDLK